MSKGGSGGGNSPTYYTQQAADLWNQLPVPVTNKTPYSQEQYVGDFTPASFTPTFTNLANFQESNPQLQADEEKNVGQLEDIASNGMTSAQKQAANLINQTVNQAFGANTGSINNSMAARGQQGGGLGYLSSLVNASNAANLGNQQGNQTIQQMNANKIAAIQAGSNMASGVRNQNYQIGMGIQNRIDAYNAMVDQMKNNASAANIANQNAASQMNLANRQNISNANTQIGNTNLDRANALSQQDWANILQKISGQSGALLNQSNSGAAAQAAAAQQLNSAAQLGMSGIGLGIAGFTPGRNGTSAFGNLFGSGGATSGSLPGSQAAFDMGPTLGGTDTMVMNGGMTPAAFDMGTFATPAATGFDLTGAGAGGAALAGAGDTALAAGAGDSVAELLPLLALA